MSKRRAPNAIVDDFCAVSTCADKRSVVRRVRTATAHYDVRHRLCGYHHKLRWKHGIKLPERPVVTYAESER